MMAGSMNGGQSRARTDNVGRLFRDTLVVSGRGYLYQLPAAASWTSLPFLTLIRQPALVMGGEHDPIIPVSNARILATLLPHATLHVYPGGHVEPLTAATDFGPRVIPDPPPTITIAGSVLCATRCRPQGDRPAGRARPGPAGDRGGVPRRLVPPRRSRGAPPGQLQPSCWTGPGTSAFPGARTSTPSRFRTR